MNQNGRDQNDVSKNNKSLDIMGGSSLQRNHSSRQSGIDRDHYDPMQESERPSRNPEGRRPQRASEGRRAQDPSEYRRPQSAPEGRRAQDPSEYRRPQSAPERRRPQGASEGRRSQSAPERMRPQSASEGRRAQDAAEYRRMQDSSEYRRPQRASGNRRPGNSSGNAARPSTPNRGRMERQSASSRNSQNHPRSSKRPNQPEDSRRRQTASASQHPSQEKQGRGPQKRSRNVFGIILVILQGILSVVFLIALKILDILPVKYYIAAVALIVLLFGFVLFTQLKKRKRVLSIVGKVLSVILCLALGFGNYYLIITNNALEKITGDTAGSVIYMDVAVLSSDPAKNIQDAADYTFGTNAIFQPKNLNTALQEIESDIGKRPKTSDYASAMEQIDALFAKEVGAIIYNRDFKKTMEEKYTTFDNDVRIIKTIKIQIESDIASGSTVDVTKEPFLVYISGNDELGPVSAEGRTDVNMLIAVNPNTHQVLMINTPRDYFVELPGVSEGKRDKLTHSGIHGIQCQIDTMNAIYGYDIDFYFKINFTSLIEIVDALGGIDLYNDYEFAFTYSDTVFEKGNIHLDGWQALEYCRERKNLESGDEDRGRHQQIVIEAIMNKLLSSSGMAAYDTMLKALETYCLTNMPKESISALIKMQLDKGGDWTVSKSGAQGEGMVQITYSMPGTGLFVVMPYVESIQNMQQMLGELYAGDEITVHGILDPDTDKLTLVAQPEEVPDTPEDSDDSDNSDDEESSEEGGEDTENGDEG